MLELYNNIYYTKNMDANTILKVENLPNNNTNIKQCIRVNTEEFPPCYRADVVVADGNNHWSFSVFIDTLDDDIILTDCQLFFDGHTLDRDNLNLYKRELKEVKKIISKYEIIHKYDEEECINELYKIVKPENVESEVKNFIECLKEMSIKLNMETSEQLEVNYAKAVREYEEIKKQKKVENISDGVKVVVLFVVAIFFIFFIKYPIQTILIMFGIGIVALVIKAILYMCTFWLPGGDLWKM